MTTSHRVSQPGCCKQSSARGSAGFSLVELVIVIAISGVIAAILGVFIVRPIQGYDAQVRRAGLVDQAESALRRMQRDIQIALPNSVRVRTPSGNVGDASCPTNNGVCVIEILHSVDGGRYCADPRCTEPPGPAGDPLRFNGTDTTFDVMGQLATAGAIDTSNHWLVVNNQTAAGAFYNAYNCSAAGPSHNCVRLDSATDLAASPPRVVLSAAFAPTLPPLASQQQRFYVVDTPVTFLCDTTARTLTRYQGYTITADHASVDTNAELLAAGAASARVADLVVACRVTYQPGAPQRAGLVTLDLTIEDSNVNGQAERVRLLHQVHVYNTP